MGRHLTEKEKIKISKLHSKGNSYEEIREKLGRKVSDTSIIRYKDYSRSTSEKKEVEKPEEVSAPPSSSGEGPEYVPNRVEGKEVESAFIEEKDTRTQKKKPKEKKKKEVVEKDGRTYFLIETAETSKIDNWEEKKKRLLNQGYKYLAVVDGEFEVFKGDEI